MVTMSRAVEIANGLGHTMGPEHDNGKTRAKGYKGGWAPTTRSCCTVEGCQYRLHATDGHVTYGQFLNEKCPTKYDDHGWPIDWPKAKRYYGATRESPDSPYYKGD